MVDSALRLAWFTPLRPVESGISQYSEDLLPVLARAWQIDVFVDGYRPTHLRESDNLRVRMAREFRAAHRARPYDPAAARYMVHTRVNGEAATEHAPMVPAPSF